MSGNLALGIKPGDFFVTTGGHEIGTLIQFFERIDKEDIPPKYLDLATEFEHAGLVSQVGPDGVMLLEEGGNGQVEVPYHYQNALIMWSTGVIVPKPENRPKIVATARTLKGHKYGWLTYGALTLHHYHVNVPGLKTYINDSREDICSQAVDYAWDQSDEHIFTDNRWPGDVKPSDLAYRLLERGAKPIWP
jgi:hypothetical protein